MILGPLAARLTESPQVASREPVTRLRGQLAGSAEGRALLSLMGDGATGALLDGVASGSPFIASLIRRSPALALDTMNASPEERLSALLTGLAERLPRAAAVDAMRDIRETRRAGALLIALADLGGVWSNAQCCTALTRLAEVAVAGALAHLFARAATAGTVDTAQPAGLFILGMGKLGAAELNFSSDIDIIAFYDRDRLPLPRAIDSAAFCVAMVRDLARLLADSTADGAAFRVDLRLRPDPGSTQVAISTLAASLYYEDRGQNWERAAYIKARCIAGDMAAGNDFLTELAPYIWRKYLDFAAIADIHAMKRQIHAHKGHGNIATAGHDIKLGRGGIREIEFFVQTQQLIAGGKQPELRHRGTLAALAGLAARGWITSLAASQLTECYTFLRRIEHRLQMVDDAQTHTLPADPARFVNFARFSDYHTSEQLSEAVVAVLRTVETHYGALFERSPQLTPARTSGNLSFTGSADDPGTLATLAALGFADPAGTSATLRGWHFGRVPAMRSPRARAQATELTPALLDALAATGQPTAALGAFDRFLSRLPSGVQLFALLHANPALLDRLIAMLADAPRLGDELATRPRLLEALIAQPPDPEHAEAEMTAAFKRARSREEALDALRICVREYRFAIGAEQLAAARSADASARAYATVAQGAIRAVLPCIVAEAGMTPAQLPVILGMGRLGGRAMTATSDLDLILLYDGAAGPGATQYARLTQRFIAALAAPTAEGIAYTVDLRLRPSGRSGPVASSIAAFAQYQAAEAWTWEHMALTRARVLAGPPALAAAAQGIIADVLTRPRDRASLAADVRAMRERIATEKGDADVWDLKRVRGGLVDIEFIAQFLQLAHAARHPAVLSPETALALAALREAGALNAAQADRLIGAADFYERVWQMLRLAAAGRFRPETAPAGLIRLVCAAAGAPDLQRLEAELAAARADVTALFAALVVG